MFIDDEVFPTTARGLAAAGMVLESANCGKGKGKCKNGKCKGIAESDDDYDDDDDIMESDVEKYAKSQARSDAMSAVLTWIDEGDFSYDELDSYVVGMAGIDDADDATEEDEAVYNDIWQEVPDALIELGADPDEADAIVNGPGREADKAALRVGNALAKEMNVLEAENSEIIVGFALGHDAIMECLKHDPVRLGILEAAYKPKKVIRDGKVAKVNKRVSGTVHRTSAQKRALALAQKASRRSSANIKRQKSRKKGEQRGLY